MTKLQVSPSSLSVVLAAPLLLLACVDDAGEPVADGDTSADTDTGETGDGVDDTDSDQDGLTDLEEAELGTDPNDKDTDDDNYWDSWEVLEGTDPLDLDSRIYTGWWPYNPAKDELPQGSWDTASTTPGAQFPRDAFYDRHGELVDIYDFANFTINSTGEPAYFIFDVSAQWCGPCHAMAYWLGGVISDDTQGLRDAYPTIPDKVHDLRVWWVTFIVEGGDGSPPDLGDPQVWFEAHPDNYIPVFADVDQRVLQNFSGGFFPFVFLVDPTLAIVSWDDDLNAGNPYYAFDFVEHELP